MTEAAAGSSLLREMPERISSSRIRLMSWGFVPPSAKLTFVSIFSAVSLFSFTRCWRKRLLMSGGGSCRPPGQQLRLALETEEGHDPRQ